MFTPISGGWQHKNMGEEEVKGEIKSGGIKRYAYHKRTGKV
ncbi:hypothetical protein ES703_45816 [subsurface metagenome]